MRKTQRITYMLLPLPEPRLLGLDLLAGPFPERLVLFVLGVLELVRLLLAELARLAPGGSSRSGTPQMSK